jgi:hypothetical protein
MALRVAEGQPGPAEPRETYRRIHEEVLSRSRAIRQGNFSSIYTGDLALLFELYDQHLFGNAIRRKLEETGHRLHFDLSKRLTSAGGNTKCLGDRSSGGLRPGTPIRIAISVTLLWHTFLDEKRTVAVNGIECRDRLEALQRVFEHELVHLIELLLWGSSSCATPRFRSIAGKFFAHTEVTHRLVTTRERAREQYGIVAGDKVSFSFDGRRLTGILNRITKRRQRGACREASRGNRGTGSAGART